MALNGCLFIYFKSVCSAAAALLFIKTHSASPSPLISAATLHTSLYACLMPQKGKATPHHKTLSTFPWRRVIATQIRGIRKQIELSVTILDERTVLTGRAPPTSITQQATGWTAATTH